MISAVGHETDTTLIDFVSDLRAGHHLQLQKSGLARNELIARIDELNFRLKHPYNKLNNNKDRLNSPIKLLVSQIRFLIIKLKS